MLQRSSKKGAHAQLCMCESGGRTRGRGTSSKTVIVFNHNVPRSSQNQFIEKTNFVYCCQPQLLRKYFRFCQLALSKLRHLQRKRIFKDRSVGVPSLHVNRMCSRNKRDGGIQRTGVNGEFGDAI